MLGDEKVRQLILCIKKLEAASNPTKKMLLRAFDDNSIGLLEEELKRIRGRHGFKNIHTLDLNVSKEDWDQSAWFVLLPNCVNFLDTENFVVNSRKVILKCITTLSTPFHLLTEKDFLFSASKLIDLPPGQGNREILESMQRIFTVFIMCKRVLEKNIDKSMTVFFEILKNYIANIALATYIETLYQFGKNKVIQPCCVFDQTLFNGTLSVLIANDIDLDTVKKWIIDQGLAGTEFGKTMGNMADAFFNQDVKKHEETLCITFLEKGYLDEIKEEVDPRSRIAPRPR